MLTNAEKRFIKSWEEQRKGGRTAYYLLYILTGTFISSVALAFLNGMFMAGFVENIPYIVIGSLVIVTVATVLSWANNEKKFRRIIQREINEGKLKDSAINPGTAPAGQDQE